MQTLVRFSTPVNFFVPILSLLRFVDTCCWYLRFGYLLLALETSTGVIKALGWGMHGPWALHASHNCNMKCKEHMGKHCCSCPDRTGVSLARPQLIAQIQLYEELSQLGLLFSCGLLAGCAAGRRAAALRSAYPATVQRQFSQCSLGLLVLYELFGPLSRSSLNASSRVQNLSRPLGCT